MRRHIRLPVLMRSAWLGLMSAVFVFEYGAAARAADAWPATHPAVAEWIHANADPKVARIEQEVQRREKTNPAAAKVLEKDLERVRDLLAGRAPAAAGGANRELHVVGVYGSRASHEKHVVEVQATKMPITLVLCAYDPVKWEITLDEGAKVRRVIVGGYYAPEINFTDPANQVPLEKHICKLKDPNWFCAHVQRGDDYLRVERTLGQLTGQEIATFQGQYGANGGHYIVGPGNPLWVEQLIQQEVQPLYREATALDRAQRLENAPEMFYAIHFAPVGGAHWIGPNGRPLPPAMPVGGLGPALLAHFSVRGPLSDSYQPLPVGATAVAVDPGRKTAYVIRH